LQRGILFGLQLYFNDRSDKPNERKADMQKDIRLVRVDAGVNQKELADELGWNRETIIDIERGRIGIVQATYDLMLGAITKLEKRRKEDGQCREVIAAA
jgi:ribosome-binding protein aMBF1 (putative translation factor)